MKDAIDGRYRGKIGPPFFDGSLILVILMATSVWGPMRFREIELLMGKRVPSSKTGAAVRYLASLQICAVTRRNATNIWVELDRRHPAAMKLRRLCRKLYRLYFASSAMKLPVRGGKQIRYLTLATPKYDPQTVNMHVLGDRPQMRVLHLLAEARSLPAFMIRQIARRITRDIQSNPRP